MEVFNESISATTAGSVQMDRATDVAVTAGNRAREGVPVETKPGEFGASGVGVRSAEPPRPHPVNRKAPIKTREAVFVFMAFSLYPSAIIYPSHAEKQNDPQRGSSS